MTKPRPTPAPPRRTPVCQRYERNGLRCTTPTTRQDGWCGTCAGYTTPQKAAPLPPWPSEGTGAAYEPGWPDVELEDVPDIEITQSAVNSFVAKHHTSREAALVQIRSLLEDMVLAPDRKGRRYKDNGQWIINTPRRDYTLMLSHNLEAVVHYRTTHAERTWAQVKAGVKSRITRSSAGSGSGSSSGRRWLMDLAVAVSTEHLPPGVLLSARAAGLYAKRRGLPRLRQDSAAPVVAQVAQALAAALAHWDGEPGRLADPHHPDSWWLITEANQEDECTHVVCAYATPESALQAGTEQPAA